MSSLRYKAHLRSVDLSVNYNQRNTMILTDRARTIASIAGISDEVNILLVRFVNKNRVNINQCARAIIQLNLSNF